MTKEPACGNDDFLRRYRQIYPGHIGTSCQAKARQIKHLARVGIAATETIMVVEDVIGALRSVFELIHMNAEDIHEELEDQSIRSHAETKLR